MKLDVTRMMAGAEDLLEKTDNPRHRAILQNYRRHAMLEVSGRFDEIFHPNMTVPDPEYWVYRPEGRIILSGMDEVVKHFYSEMARTASTVMILENETIAVNDFGFNSEYMSHSFVPGHVARARGFDVDDLDAMYIHNHWVIMTWIYSDDCRLIGEHVHGAPGGTIRYCPPEEVVTQEEARIRLAPLIGDPPPRYDRFGKILAEAAPAA
ncbi:hypothetical protein [Sphingopyxis sp. KK2]|jgi:hypothetical protein|uniref:hypothetical protein n=1 Tax=Sphingopyxis sp. KK2 TaxID=1855727 RepID=UPI00097E6118|nr:hypothetical protein [Sphingopyxis sp. KK2]